MASTVDMTNRQRPTRARTWPGSRPGSRAAAFVRARRHSTFVRSMRMLLPLTAVALFASYGLYMQRSFRVGAGKLEVGAVAISGENLVAGNPHYDGVNKDGSRFDVRAKSAEHNFRQTGPIALKTIEGTLTEPNNTKTLLKAVRGSFDPQTNVLELYERIDVTSESGLVAELTQATVYAKENRIVSKQPVVVRMPTGTVNGNEMVLLQKTRQVTFLHGVKAVVQPQARPETGGGAAPSRLFGGRNGPIDVTSARLEIDDVRKVAVFKEAVRATQAEATLTAPELQVHYEGQPVGVGAPAGGDAAGRLKRLVVPREVVLTQGADRVTSERGAFDVETEKAVLQGNVVITSGRERQAVADRADLDSKADSALLTGNVVVTQGKNVLKGRRLFVDRKAGTSNLVSPADRGGQPGRISARFYRADSEGAPKAKAAAPAQQTDPLGFNFRTDPSAPIDIDAEVLDTDDHAKTATFRGHVKAVQGDFTVTTPELVAYYTGETAIGLSAQPAAAGAAAQLQRLHAKKRVVITSKDDQKAAGDRADFDVKANTVTLTGDVVLTKDRQVINGPKLVIDMTTGISRMDTAQPRVAAPQQTAPPAGQSKEPAAAGAHGACPPGRMCGLFYLDEMKNKAKQKAPALLEKHNGAEAKVPRKDAGKTGGGGDGWSSATEVFERN